MIMAKTALDQNTLRVILMCFQKWRREQLIWNNSRKEDRCSCQIIARNSEPLPLAMRDETLPCALFLFIGKCMKMIV